MRVHKPGTPIADDEHPYNCNECDNRILVSGHPDTLPDGGDVTPPGMGDDDFDDDEGRKCWTCLICGRRAYAGQPDDDE